MVRLDDEAKQILTRNVLHAVYSGQYTVEQLSEQVELLGQHNTITRNTFDLGTIPADSSSM